MVVTTKKGEVGQLRALFDKYKLYYDQDNPNSKDNDVFIHKHYKIITRQGIQKIEAQAGIVCMFFVEHVSPELCVVRGTGTMGSKIYNTFGSANTDNSPNDYLMEIAEKRCRSRLVLSLAGLYELGFFGQEEAKEFDDKVTRIQSDGVTATTLFKK
jgi:hypothetical protein